MKTIKFGKITFDYSRTLLTEKDFKAIELLARLRDLPARRKALFAGEKINTTSGTAALHTALRAKRGSKVYVDGADVVAGVHEVLDRMKLFSEQVRTRVYKGYSGKAITDIVHIGMGGSILGPRMVTRAFSDLHPAHLNAHFVSGDIEGVLKRLSPETTLFVIVSKTFTTKETLLMARIARDWFTSHGGNLKQIKKHLVGVTENVAAAVKYGIAPENVFPIWDWVGGRYSVWSAVGLTAMIMIGADNFQKLLDGASKADRHFQTASLRKNIPCLMAMIGLAHRNIYKYPAVAVLPYPPQLEFFPLWVQQLDMESNGKSVCLDGKKAKAATGPIVFGAVGEDAQHSFFQWLHQGSDIVPLEFIALAGDKNCICQADILRHGQKNKAEPHKSLPGGRPSTVLSMNALTPENLGALLAFYEHKIFVQGALWNINSFDQCGVEMAKIISKKVM